MKPAAPTSQQPFPAPIPVRKLLGPSFIILALGLGSGEVILWPYLVANHGLGIAWGALLGISCQFFINMEIERYALVRGESVFVGFHRHWRWTPYWFIASTFIGFGLPGIIAASAQVIAPLVGVSDFRWVAAGLLIAIGLIISFGKTVYGLMEGLTKTILLVGIPGIVVLTIAATTPNDWQALGAGLLGQGNGYAFLPTGIALATFFGAFAYSGAGGNLNLTQSIYIKEKGYGMGAYAQKISGLFTNLKQRQHLRLAGHTFALTPDNLQHFRQWWRRINFEHGLVFWGCGFVGIAVLMLLAFTTTFGLPNNAEGIQFVINEGSRLGVLLHPMVGLAFLILVAVMLFQTQLGILDSTSRIMAENAALAKLGQHQTEETINLSKVYFICIWAQIAFGIVLFALDIAEPRSLIVLGAVLNAIAMFVHIGLTTLLNRTLPGPLRPKLWRTIILLIIFCVFGAFSAVTIWNVIAKLI